MATEINLEDYNWDDLENYPNVGIDKDGKLIELSFNGNNLIRPYNTKLIISPKAEEEEKKCAEDLFYFIENYCKITTLKDGIVKVKLRDYQKEFLFLLLDERFIISSQARRAGKTTINALYIVWNICFKKSYTAGISANKAELTLEIVNMVKDIYQNLPPFLQQGIKKWNARSIELKNGSKVKSSVMGPNSFRGGALNFLLIDETAWIDSNKYNAFEDSVMPTIATANNTQVVKISTPNGLNHFYKDVQEAKNGTNGYVYFEVHWSRIDIYTPEWAQGELKRIGPIKFNQNYAIQFIGSSNTLLKGETLALLIKSEPLDTDFLIEDDKIYKTYNPNSVYAITVDSSKSVGTENSDNDYISVNVIEIGKKIEQVYTYRTNSIHYTELAGIVYDIGEYYNFPLCIIENNEGSGTYTANRLFEHYDYPNMYFDPAKDGLEVGIRTKSSNRGIGLSTLKKLIEDGIFILNDSDTIDEFFTFIKVGKRYEAQGEATDDCVMSLNLLMYILMDINNDLEVTINDYLEGTVVAKEENEDSTDDVDFVANARLNSNDNWLVQSQR